MAALRAELDGGGETDAAMAFLATAIKDHSAVPASNMLFRLASFMVVLLLPAAQMLQQFDDSINMLTQGSLSITASLLGALISS